MDNALSNDVHAAESTEAYHRAVPTPTNANGLPEFARAPTSGDLTPFIAALVGGRTLLRGESQAAFECLMSGECHPAEIGALLALLATRVPTPDELAGAATVMRAHVDPVDTGVPADALLDTAGTGGTTKLFNVSTAAAIIAAAAGAKVAKHGNRSRTGRGSAEVLMELGVCVDAGRETQRRCMDEVGICFCFAIHHHPATRHVMPVRKALGIPTIFNLLGPLTNPAGAKRQIVGVYAPQFVRPVADALAMLGALRAVVVHGTDGLDECSITSPTMIADVQNGVVTERLLSTSELGFPVATHADLAAGDLAGAAQLLSAILTGGERGARRHMAVANAGLAIMAAGLAENVSVGIQLAEAAIDSGGAAQTLERLRIASRH
jgi:anthranilate phosphoribosyltransferase